ncbi:MAG: hypothetical protein JWM99_5267 [Verrucomicrobiales bacterium]|nr:hypothetical protein [Verrucomicrobiales bacterium]
MLLCPQFPDQIGFHLAKPGFSFSCENLRYVFARPFFDFGVCIDKLEMECFGNELSHRALSRSHEPNQSYVSKMSHAGADFAGKYCFYNLIFKVSILVEY